jgi:transposase
MRDIDLYATILGVRPPWSVSNVDLRRKEQEVYVTVRWRADEPVSCPECRKQMPGYDSVERTWRHLDTCQYGTFLVAHVPRVNCTEHGVLTIQVPWADPKSGFTALFEAVVIDWLMEASISAVARQLRLTWDQVSGIQARAVARGLARRSIEDVTLIGVDETSFQKRHEYVTSVVDLVNPKVLHVADGRGQDALDGFYKQLSPEQRARIEAVAMDMWDGYVKSTEAYVPGAEEKIAFDRFHVARHLGEAVNAVRKAEHRDLIAKGDKRLLRTKYQWLKRPEDLASSLKESFRELRDSNLKTARAWAIKETARDLWSYGTRAGAERGWKKWLAWAVRSRLEPIKKAAATIRDHLKGIVNAVVLNVTNATTESLNSKIQWIKRTACGFRNRERFRNAIYFHCGGLDLYPAALSTHSSS